MRRAQAEKQLGELLEVVTLGQVELVGAWLPGLEVVADEFGRGADALDLLG